MILAPSLKEKAGETKGILASLVWLIESGLIPMVTLTVSGERDVILFVFLVHLPSRKEGERYKDGISNFNIYFALSSLSQVATLLKKKYNCTPLEQ